MAPILVHRLSHNINISPFTFYTREGYAELSIVVNSPPYGGRVSASPSTGSAALDPFVLEALDWTDDADDLPLFFSFAYFNGEVRVESQVAPSDRCSATGNVRVSTIPMLLDERDRLCEFSA